MFERTGHRLLVLCALVMAVLMGALAPVLAQAFQPRGGSGWVVVCTESGSKWIEADPAASAHDAADHRVPGHDATHLFEHCPYCSMHAAHLGMPPLAPALPAMVARFTAHRRYVAAAPARDVWSDAQSRGPPLIA